MRIMILSGKTSDMCVVHIKDEDGNVLVNHNGYVPYVNTIGGGDYIELEINENGQVLDWNPDTFDQIIESIKEDGVI